MLELRLSGNNLGDKNGLTILDGLLDNNNIKIIDLTKNNLTDNVIYNNIKDFWSNRSIDPFCNSVNRTLHWLE